MRFILLFLLLFSLDWYIFTAYNDWVQYLGTFWSFALRFSLWILPMLILFSILYFYKGKRENVRQKLRTLGTLLFIIFAAKVMTTSILLIGDAVRWITVGLMQLLGNAPIYTDRPEWLLVAGVILPTIPVIVLIYGMLRNRYRYRVFREKVEINDLPEDLEGLKIVQISDIHAGSFTSKKGVAKGVNKILEEEPHLVFFTGDLVNTVASEILPYVQVFSKIDAKYGVYSVLGNHDYGDYVKWNDNGDKLKNRDALEAAHRVLGWELLNNENKILNIGNAQLAVIGVENISGNKKYSIYGDMEKATRGTEEADLRICMSHDPTHWESEITKDFKDIEITLSGHTHGGQIGVEFGKLKWSPIQHVYKHWAGLYKKADQYLYVNRGFGFLGYPGRVGILAEITVLELTRKK